MMRELLSPASLLLLIFAVIAGCSGGDSQLESVSVQVGASPTGTFLEPIGGDGAEGYRTLDEACEGTDAPDYLDRFRTPMFRDSVAVGDLVYLVDGSMLWVVSIADPTRPERLSLRRLPGHPLAVAVTDAGALLVAAGEAGLLVMNVRAPERPLIEHAVELPGPALDVDVDGAEAYVAVGAEGIVTLNLEGAPSVAQQRSLPGFANAVRARAGRAYVAACSHLNLVDFQGESPELLGSYWVPEGHAKELYLVEDELFVAGGEALFAFDVTDPAAVTWRGFYADPEAVGFYVNAVVVQEGVAYIAAGDESVRAVNVSELSDAEVYLPPAGEGAPPSLQDPIALPEPSIGTIEINFGDPINVGLAGELLLVLGNYRWVGERLLRVMDISTPGTMVDVGDYTQPDHTRGVDDYLGDILVHGAEGEERILTQSGAELSRFELPSTARGSATSGEWLFLISEEGLFRYDGQSLEQLSEDRYGAISAFDEYIYLTHPASNSLEAVQNRENTAPRSIYYWRGMTGSDPAPPSDPRPPTLMAQGETPRDFLGFARLLASGERLYAYDWSMGLLHSLDVSYSLHTELLTLTDVGQCELYDLEDFYSGQRESRAELVAEGDRLYLLCPQNASGESRVLVFDTASALAPPEGGLALLEERALPKLSYVDLAVSEGIIYALAYDNNRYRSSLLQLEGEVTTRIDFDGHANQLLPQGESVLVADGDFGLRRFTREGAELVELQPFTRGGE